MDGGAKIEWVGRNAYHDGLRATVRPPGDGKNLCGTNPRPEGYWSWEIHTDDGESKYVAAGCADTEGVARRQAETVLRLGADEAEYRARFSEPFEGERKHPRRTEEDLQRELAMESVMMGWPPRPEPAPPASRTIKVQLQPTALEVVEEADDRIAFRRDPSRPGTASEQFEADINRTIRLFTEGPSDLLRSVREGVNRLAEAMGAAGAGGEDGAIVSALEQLRVRADRLAAEASARLQALSNATVAAVSLAQSAGIDPATLQGLSTEAILRKARERIAGEAAWRSPPEAPPEPAASKNTFGYARDGATFIPSEEVDPFEMVSYRKCGAFPVNQYAALSESARKREEAARGRPEAATPLAWRIGMGHAIEAGSVTFFPDASKPGNALRQFESELLKLVEDKRGVAHEPAAIEWKDEEEPADPVSVAAFGGFEAMLFDLNGMHGGVVCQIYRDGDFETNFEAADEYDAKRIAEPLLRHLAREARREEAERAASARRLSSAGG